MADKELVRPELEIEITQEMIEAGAKELSSFDLGIGPIGGMSLDETRSTVKSILQAVFMDRWKRRSSSDIEIKASLKDRASDV